MASSAQGVGAKGERREGSQEGKFYKLYPEWRWLPEIFDDNQTSWKSVVFLLSLPVCPLLVDVEGIPAPGASTFPHADLSQGVGAVSAPSWTKSEMSTKLS